MMSEHFEDFVGSLTSEQREKLRIALGAAEPDNTDSSIEESVSEEANVREDFTVTRKPIQQGKYSVQAGKNTWVDSGELKDVETPEFERTPRNRPKPQVVETACHVCGKRFKVNQSIVYGEFYRCDRCTGR
jgi:hypothetical protein